MVNLRLICETVERGAIEGVRYGHNQYGPFESTNIWEKDTFPDGFYPMNDFLPTLSTLWASMTLEEKGHWAYLANKYKTSCWAQFTRLNVRLMMDGLEPSKTPY